ATFCIFQSKNSPGLGVIGEKGTLVWSELNTHDIPKARAFYGKFFGWETHTGKMPEDNPDSYVHIRLNGRDFGGMFRLPDNKAQVPPHWIPYFQVAGCDQSTSLAKEIGGSVCVPPRDIENAGRFSVVADPQGAAFALFEAL